MHHAGAHVPEIARENAWITTDDGFRLHQTSWKPSSTVRSNVLIVHGHGEHMGRYGHVAAHLVLHGHAVLGFDLRGHGRSQGRSAYVDRFEQYVADTDAVVERIRERSPDRPLYLLGHSLGGLIALHYALTRTADVAGVMVSSPFITASIPIPRPLLMVSGLLSRFFPTLPTLDISRRPLTHDAQIVAMKEADPLAYRGRILARTGNEMRLAGQEIRERAKELLHPLLLFHGTEDQLADWRGSLAVYADAASHDKTLTLYNGLFHETLNESRREHVLSALTDWLEEHVP